MPFFCKFAEDLSWPFVCVLGLCPQWPLSACVCLHFLCFCVVLSEPRKFLALSHTAPPAVWPSSFSKLVLLPVFGKRRPELKIRCVSVCPHVHTHVRTFNFVFWQGVLRGVAYCSERLPRLIYPEKLWVFSRGWKL